MSSSDIFAVGFYKDGELEADPSLILYFIPPPTLKLLPDMKKRAVRFSITGQTEVHTGAN